MKCYLKTKEVKNKQRSSVPVDKRPNQVPLLVKPQVTNMKEFSRKLNTEDSKFDQKCTPIKNPKVQQKLMENVFQPIQCENTEINDDEDNILFSKNDKTIHESLRMSKTKRRKSLPSFDEPKDSLESLSNIENDNSKSYNISYYTSISKGKQSDTGSNEYYSSSLNCGKSKGRKDEGEVTEVYPHKFVPDGYAYGVNKSHKRRFDKLPTSVSTDSIKQDCEYDIDQLNNTMPKRISVTEPSSPASAYTSKYAVAKVLKMKNENTESDLSETESECNSTPVVSKVRKSKSFTEQKSRKKNYEPNVIPLREKNPKGNKVKARKLSRSSTSSCDSFCPSQSLRRNTKLKVNNENTKPFKCETNSLNHRLKGACGCGEKLRDQKGRSREQARMNRDRSLSTDNREMPSSSRMNAEMYLHLLDVLLQKNHKERYPPQAFTKSLPRNHKSKCPERPARELSHQCSKDCLKVMKMTKPEGSPGNRSAPKKSANEHMNFTPKKNNPDKFKDKKTCPESSSGRRSEPVRCSCSPYTCYNAFCNQQGVKYLKKPNIHGVDKHKNERGEKLPANRTKESRTKNRPNDEECVITIEDEQLWIKICKAVEEVNFKEKNLKMSD